MMRKLTFFCGILAIVFNLFSIETSLKPKYRNWLELVRYIITPTEKEAFLKLKSDSERELFIKIFWQKRDPIPATPENEFKKELVRRFNYANKHFGHGSPKPGYLTDRGKIYIILGPPQRVEKLTHVEGIYPTIIWDYYGVNLPGLPRNFQLVFFKREGVGEYILYDPISDGPESLLKHTGVLVGRDDYRRIYVWIRRLAPNLVGPAFSLVPTARKGPVPSIESSLLLSNIEKVPYKMVDDSYAEDFLKLRKIVEVEADYNLVKSQLLTTIQYDPVSDLMLLHFAIKPERISLEYSQNRGKFFSVFDLQIFLKKGDKTIYQEERKSTLYFTKKQVEKEVKPMGISLAEVVPVPPGEFKLILILRQPINNLFSYVEKTVKIPEKNGRDVMGPLFSYASSKENSIALIRPFSFAGNVFKIDPDNNFSPQDIIYSGFSLLGATGDVTLKVFSLDEPGKPLAEFSIKKLKPMHFQTIKLGRFPPGDYTVEIDWAQEQGIIKKTGIFTVSLNRIPHPMMVIRGIPIEGRGVLYFKIAEEYVKLGYYEEAEKFFKKGFGLKPDFYPGVVKFAYFLLRRRKPDGTLKIVEALKEKPGYEFQYFSLKGRAHFMERKYTLAIGEIKNALRIFPQDYTLLNLLGVSYIEMGDYRKALFYLEKSVSINPHQKRILKYIKELKAKIKED